MEISDYKKILNKELEQFNCILDEVLPRYIQLMKKFEPTAEEQKELGEIELFLMDINSQIAEIKSKLDKDMFGQTMNRYYAVKRSASKGDQDAIKELKMLRSAIEESIKGDYFFNWN